MRHQLRILYRQIHQHPISHPKKPTSITPFFQPFTTNSSVISSNSPSIQPNSMNVLAGIFSARNSKTELVHKVCILKDELLKHKDDIKSVDKVLCDSGLPLFSCYVDGSALIELLKQIRKFPLLAVQVFNWRRKHADINFPISSKEYAKGIRVAGHAKDIDFAVELYTEAGNNRCKTSSTYNALMGAYMVNGLTEKCQELFRKFKEEQSCSPNIVTYNILISVFGRVMLIDHMEATLQEIHDSGLIPDVNTFNNLITGYVIAWMWDRMENTFLMMKETSLEPDTWTYKLMARGYAHAGNLKKMEEMFELLKRHSNEDDILLVKTMISACRKSSCPNKIEMIDELLKLIPECEYRSWFTVSLIEVYAKEKLLDRMEEIIDIALKNNVVVTSVVVMRSITSAYFHHKAVDKLSSFVKCAESAGWRLCRSLYHCKLMLYGSDRRLEEMENVLEEMEKLNIDNRTKKTLVILSTSYSTWGPKCKLEQVVALMWKLGYDCDWQKFPL